MEPSCRDNREKGRFQLDLRHPCRSRPNEARQIWSRWQHLQLHVCAPDSDELSWRDTSYSFSSVATTCTTKTQAWGVLLWEGT